MWMRSSEALIRGSFVAMAMDASQYSEFPRFLPLLSLRDCRGGCACGKYATQRGRRSLLLLVVLMNKLLVLSWDSLGLDVTWYVSTFRFRDLLPRSSAWWTCVAGLSPVSCPEEIKETVKGALCRKGTDINTEDLKIFVNHASILSYYCRNGEERNLFGPGNSTLDEGCRAASGKVPVLAVIRGMGDRKRVDIL